MTEIVRSKDCGNSPKNLRAQNLAVALATGDGQMAAELLAGDVRWEVVGGGVFEGLEAVVHALDGVDSAAMATVTIDDVLTHGKKGAVSGTIDFGGYGRRFCDVYEFSSAKGTHIRRITSYRIDN